MIPADDSFTTPLQHRFIALDELLASTYRYWQTEPFQLQDRQIPDCLKQDPQLSDFLCHLSQTELDQLSTDANRWFALLQPLIPSLSGLRQHQFVSDSSLVELPDYAETDYPGISAAKREQIIGFVAQLTPRIPVALNSITDWCSGKGHLAQELQRRLARTTTCLEYDQSLCASGKRLYPTLTFRQQDVLQALPEVLFNRKTVHTALHACGELHRQFLHRNTHAGSPLLALAPCCYHKGTAASYQPLSAAATDSHLLRHGLHNKLVRMATQHSQKNTAAQRQLRLREQQWRLGFDQLQRQLTQNKDYLNVPSCAKSLLKTNFHQFCTWAAEQKGIALPAELDFADYLQQGRQRWQWVRRFELLREPFRRALESWLILDQALFLVEQGYQVEVRNFCSADSSPRNLLILAANEQTIAHAVD